MDHLVHCWKFLSSPPPWLKAWLERQFLTHLKAYDERVTILKEDIDSLKKRRYAIHQQVKEEVNRYNRGILNLEEVEEWLKEANETIIKYEEFIQDKDHEFAKFDVLTSGYLPKARIRLRLSKETFNIIENISELLNKANHDTFSYWLGPPSMVDLFENRSYESFPSRDATMKNIKEALENPKVTIIGLHGSSGVGKTTLVKEIIREALQASDVGKLFDVVALANVTRNPSITKIQGQIAETLGMKLDEETDVVRAARIRQRLKNGKESTLIILDDLWEELELKMLGIPLEDGDVHRRRSNTMKGTSFENVKDVKNLANAKHTRKKIEEKDQSKKLPSESSKVKTEETHSHYKLCKVLLISERREVLLNQKGEKVNAIYLVDVLNKKEAEAFFNKMAGIGVGSSEFEKLAAQIASKCNGMPMSIVTIARALKDQSRSVWDDTLRQLERGKLTGENGFSTRLSYNLLENEELKDAFLLCACLGPNALIMDLVKYCIGLGFLQGIYTAKEAWDRVYVLVGKLKVYGLLLDSYSINHFTMSDNVRIAALSIASKEKHIFTMTKGKIDEWPDEDKLERCTSISLHHCDIIDGFPSYINCPKLKVFHVSNNDPRLVIPKNLFDGMKELRALILTGINLSPFPLSIRYLTKLRRLCLEQCMLDKDLSFIGELKNLRILSLSGCDIENLPLELKHLTKLQIFDISNCSKLREIPSNVISSLVSLEELYMRNTLIKWEVQEHNGQSKSASLSELKRLNLLATLDMQIIDEAHFPKNLFLDKLHSYKIVIGDMNAHSDMDLKIPAKYETSKFLAIQGFDIHSQKGIKILFERVEHLFLEDDIGAKDIICSLSLKGFPYLKHLLIVNNSNIKSLILPEEMRHPDKAFLRLESLHLHNLQDLDNICSCKLSEPSFFKLKFIKINLCPNLKIVFSTSVVRLLTVLETIEVSECSALKEIVEVEPQSNLNKIEDVEFPELCYLTLQSLYDNFVGFYPTSSTKGELFTGKIIASKLERLVLSSIQVFKIWSDQLSIKSCFRSLIHLDVNGCPNLEYLMSLSMAKNLENLQTLFVSECEKMTNIFSQEKGSHVEIEGNIFPSLKNIKLSSMKRLVEIWNSKLPSNSFDKLETLIIEDCNKFVNVFPCHMEGMFQSLCKLRVANCKSVKVVFELDHNKCKGGDLTNLQDVYLETLPKLEHIWKWNNGKDGILELRSLQKMWIHDCHSLENVFTVSIARQLPSLENLVILKCFELREIVATMKDSKNDASSPFPSFEFPKLTTIKFSELMQLSCFYPEFYELSCPALNDLSIEFCYRLEPFRKVTMNAEPRPTLISKEGINKLKCMQIEWWNAMSSSSYLGEKSCQPDNLEELCLSGFMNPEFVYFLLHRNPYLKSLSLECCSLTHIVPLEIPPQFEKLGVVPKLKFLKLIDLPYLETIGFEQGIILERIEFLILNNCSSLVNMFPPYVSLTHLTNLEVINCDGLEKLMPSSVAKSLVQLNNMKVMKCESIVEIVDNEEDDAENAGKVNIVFSQLKILELVSLKNLNCFSNSYNIFEFPSLEKLVVSACPNMEFFSKKVNNTPLLKKISVVHEKEKKVYCWKDDINTSICQIFKDKKFFQGMDEISLSEHHDLQQTWHSFDGDLKRSCFYSLKTLKLEGCENLSYAIPIKILPHLKSLKELKVRNCNKVKAIFEKNDTKVTPSPIQLKILTLKGLSELVYVWENNCQGNLIFQNLQEIFVSNCERLQTLLPEALAENLKKLEKLEVESCEKLHDIIGQETNVAKNFVFPCLTWLNLYGLPELTCFYPGLCTVECHDLRQLLVLECPKLELFQIARHEGEGSGSIILNEGQALFSDLMAIRNLEELTVDSKYNSGLKSRVRQLKEKLDFLITIRVFLDVDDNEELTLALDIFKKAPNLQDMCIECCDNFEIFLDNEHWGVPPGQLESLTLTHIFGLQSINFDYSWLNTVCTKLRHLIVVECDFTRLFHIPNTEPFSNLNKLYITKCHKLEYLFTAPMAELLVSLEEITVEECTTIREIVAEDPKRTKIREVVARNPNRTTSLNIILKRLYSLTLKSLLSLECFYSGKDILQLPSLKQVDMWQCPKMEVFSRGEVNVESFRGIRVSTDTCDEPVFHKNLNILVKRVALLQMLSKGDIDGKKFTEDDELTKAWGGKLSTQDNWFYYMRTLKLDNCDFEHYVIPSKVLHHLKNLEELEVLNCKKVKLIFEMNDSETMETSQLKYLSLEGLSDLAHVWEMNYQGILSFQNLRHVNVSKCESMKALLPATLAENLTMLEMLQIKSCHELQEIVGKEDDATTNATKKFVFPRLIILGLHDLPKLTSFFPQLFTMVCPKLNNLSVMFCSKMELFQGVHPEDEGESSSTSINRRPLFLDFNTISISEELSLNRKQISVLRIGQPSFSNLKDLAIVECLGFDYLFTPSTAKKLIHLEKLFVADCSSMRTILAEDKDETPQGIEFQRLCSINLSSLSCLDCFYSGNDTLQLPSLTEVMIRHCPNMKVFSQGEINAKSFRGIQASSNVNDELIFHSDLNSSVKRIFLRQMLSESGIDEKKFLEHRELREAWDGNLSLQDNWFYSLRTLKLDNCDFEYYAIPSNVLHCLKNLGELEVRNCNKVKVIFEMNDFETRETLQLNCLTLEGLSELTRVWEMNCQGILMFRNLREVCVRDCKSMKALLPATLAERLAELEEIEIKDCGKLQEIIGKEDGAPTNVTKMFLFPRLTTLELFGLPELTSFYPELFTMVCPNLDHLYMLFCSKMQLFQYVHHEGEGETSSISINKQPILLDFKAISTMEELSLNQKQNSVLRIGESSFSNLKKLVIVECLGLEYLFTSSTTKKLIHLENISLKDCNSMKTVVLAEEDEAPHEIEFKQLRSILLVSLSSLDCFYSGNDTLQLPLVTLLRILRCPKMELFSRGDINAGSLRGIQASSDLNDELVFHNDVNCSVKMIFLQREHLVFKDSTLLKAIWLKLETVPNWGFCNLNTLIVEGCDFLSSAILPSHLIHYLSNLKILEVRKCNSVKAIFDYTKIRLEGSLNLPNLEKLCVENCDKIVEIISKDKTDTEEADQEIVKFPKVTFLKLWNLCNVKCIYPGERILQWPMLKELHVMHCPMLQFFATELANQQTFISLEQVTPCLEVLSLGKEEAKMIEEGILHVNPPKLNSIVLQCFHDESDSFPFVFGSKAPLPSIKKLAVCHSSFKGIFPPQTSDIDCTKFLSQFVTLELRSLSLVLIGIEQPWMHPFLKNLQTLLVRGCGGLRNLTPSTVSFSNLLELRVKNCRGLQYLFTSGTAKTLCMLKKLSISNCESLKAIVTKEGDEFQSDDEYVGNGQIESENESESEEEGEGVAVGVGEGGSKEEEEEEGEGEGESESESKDESEEEEEEEGKTKSEDEGEIEGEDGIIFKKLEILRLSSVPKLESFYFGTSPLKFPSLKNVSFTKCINIKIFRLVDQLPEDVEIKIDEKCQDGDINSVIMHPFEEERQPVDLVSDELPLLVQ